MEKGEDQALRRWDAKTGGRNLDEVILGAREERVAGGSEPAGWERAEAKR